MQGPQQHRDSEPASQLSISPSSVQRYELAVKRKNTTVLENSNNGANHHLLDEGIDVKDGLNSRYDEVTNIPALMICMAAAFAVSVGVILVKSQVHGNWVKWIALPGDLFVSALKCLVLPMVFSSIVVSIGQLIEMDKGIAIGGRVALYFGCCGFVSSTIGVLMGWIFSSQFTAAVKPRGATAIPRLSLRCASGGFVTGLNSSMLKCLASNMTDGSSLFRVNDTSSYFALGSTKYAKVTASEQVFSIFRDCVPENIMAAFTNSTNTAAVSIIMFSVCFGVALVRTVNRNNADENYPMLLITHANIICRLLLDYMIPLTPVAVISLIAGAMTQNSTSYRVLASIGWFTVALSVGLLLSMVVVLGVVLYITTGRSIFSWLRFISPAIIFILGCSSSTGTLPITIRCVENSREVSYALGRIVLSLGAITNLNGTAIYMPLACIFMAKVGGHDDLLTPSTYFLLIPVAAISSFGLASVPNAGLVMVMTIWQAVFNVDVPQAFALLASADWLFVRLRSIVNITNDTIICRIIAEQCGETEFVRTLGRRETVVQTSADHITASVSLSP